MAKDDWVHGSPIRRVDGEPTSLRYLSPSAITLADPESEGCLRKWWWQYVMKKKQPETASQATGTRLHAEIERYLKTGQRDLSALALAGLHMVPSPGEDLGVELEMSSEFSDPEHQFIVDEAWALRQAGDFEGAARMLEPLGILTAAGVPIIGRIDLVHARCTNQGTEDPDDAIDPPNTVEVYDWKTSSDVKRWGKTPAQLARNIQMLAYANWVLLKEPSVERVRVSHGYFQTKGSRKTRKVTTLIDRDTAVRRWEYASNLARRIVAVAGATEQEHVEPNLSACERFGGCPHKDYCKVKKSSGIAGFFAKPKTANGLTQIRKVSKTMGFLDKLRKADSERKADKITADPRFKPAWDAILALGKGQPTTGGEVAAQLALMGGRTDFDDSGLAGTGEMGAITIRTMDELIEIAAECAEETAAAPEAETETPAKPPIGLAPDAPASDPKIASAGAEGKDPLKPDKKPKVSKAKADKADPPVAAKADPPVAAKNAEIPKATPAPGVMLFVNCYPKVGRGTGGIAGQDLAPWIAEIWGRMAAEAGCDPRASQDKPFAFAGWRGVIASLVADPSETPLADGMWFLDARGSELHAAFVEALELAGRLAMIVRGL